MLIVGGAMGVIAVLAVLGFGGRARAEAERASAAAPSGRAAGDPGLAGDMDGI